MEERKRGERGQEWKGEVGEKEGIEVRGGEGRGSGREGGDRSGGGGGVGREGGDRSRREEGGRWGEREGIESRREEGGGGGGGGGKKEGGEGTVEPLEQKFFL